MKKLFKLSSLLLIALAVFQLSCDSEDTPAPVDDLIGKWALSSATFNSTNVPPTDVMSIANFPTANGPVTLPVPAGTDILQLVVGAMADNVCSSTANYATFYLELTADGKLFLHCPAEEVSEESGTWIRIEDPTLGTIITLNVAAAGTVLPIAFGDFAMLGDKSKFTGTTDGFPMVRDFAEALSGTNLQLMNADMEFTRIP